jgi:hypothetical protein
MSYASALDTVKRKFRAEMQAQSIPRIDLDAIYHMHFDVLDRGWIPLYRTTSYIKALLPDGRILESPMPSEKDGWEEVEEIRWQKGEAFARGVVGLQKKKKSVQVGDCFEFGSGDDQEYLDVPFEHEAARCWANDMVPVLLTVEQDGDTSRGTSILEVRKFRKPLSRSRVFEHHYQDPLQYMKDAPRGPYDDSDWPDGSHPRRVIQEPKKK